jgi:penicillin-binding protein 1A
VIIGFNDSLVVGVWVGNDDHSPMNGVVGGTIPAMIWKRFVEQASAPTKTIKAESGDAETALRSSRGAGSRRGSPAASRSWSRAMPRLASTVQRKARRGW